MATDVLPATVSIALLAELHPQTGRPDRLCAVLAFTDRGERHLARLPVPVTAKGILDRLIPPTPRQLPLDLQLPDGLPAASSSGRTWRTWALPSVPTGLRGLTVDEVGPVLARQLAVGALP